MLSHAKISDTPFDQRSPQPTEEGVLNCTNRQKDRHTDDHRNSMTESAQWADAVKSLLAVAVSGKI